MPAKKSAPAKATPAKKTDAKAAASGAKTETNAKAAAKSETNAKAAAKATDAKATKAAATTRRAVARPVTRVVRPEGERRAAPAAPREKRAKPEARPLPTAPQGHAPLIGADGTSSGSIALPVALAKPGKRIASVFQALMALRANARQATSATKNRHRVAGGGAKPWRQKGTGRARAGSTRSPLWRHGGVVFGPNGRQYWQRIPEKMRRAAFSEAVSARAAEGRVLVVDSFVKNGDRMRTRDAAAWLDKIGDTGATVFVWHEIDENAARAMANLPQLEMRTPGSLRLSDVLESDTLLVMRPALDALAARARGAGDSTHAGAGSRA